MVILGGKVEMANPWTGWSRRIGREVESRLRSAGSTIGWSPSAGRTTLTCTSRPHLVW